MIASTHIKGHDQKGLTLLELLLVMLILSAVAWMAVGVVENNSDQVRFEDTRNRREAIRRAIIGDTSRTVNGQPEIRGYVADMGRLPQTIQALISQEYCIDHPEKTTQADCTGAGWIWSIGDANHDQPDWSYNSTYGLWVGWKGPYLRAKELTGYQKYLDGWGNDGEGNDFGWKVTVNPATDFSLQSLGMDNAAGGTEYKADYPPTGSETLIVKNDFKLTVTDDSGNGGITVDFGAPLPCWKCTVEPTTYRKRADCVAANGLWQSVYQGTNQGTCEDSPPPEDPPNGYNGVWLPEVATPETTNLWLVVAHIINGTVSLEASNQTAFTWDSSQQTIEFKFANDTGFVQGQVAYGVFEANTSGVGTPYDVTKPFPDYAKPWQTLTIVPYGHLRPIVRPVR